MTFLGARSAEPTPHVTGLHAGDDLQASPTRLRLDGVRAHALEVGRTRLLITGLLFLLAFVAIGARIVDIAVFERAPEVAKAATQSQNRADTPDVARADIVDRNGVVLATSLPTQSLYAKAEQVQDPFAAAAKLVAVLPDLDELDTVSKLSSGKPFLYLRRNLTPHQQYDVNALGIPGLYFEKGEHRVYPLGNLLAHAVGIANIDGKGVAGLESRFDQRLLESRLPLRLSLDVRVQAVARAEVEKAVAEYKAQGGVGVVMDVTSGQILAMSSLPDFDPNDPPEKNDPGMFNRAAKGLYEMGSTFKLFTVAAALEQGTTQMDRRYDVTSPFHLRDAEIHDFHPENHPLTPAEILIHSSNIGAAKIGLELGGASQRAFLEKAGLLAPLAIELPETAQPQFPEHWRDINTATISFGHGVSVTPLHLAAGVSALVNGGLYHAPSLLAGPPGDGDRIIGEATSAKMRQMMRQVVTEGTGGKADVPGYEIAGKTGTAEKAGMGAYRKKAVLSSFVAVFPAEAPRYLVLVMIDEPQGVAESFGQITGGWTAAPAAGRIIAQIAPMLGQMPKPVARTEGKGAGND